MLKTNWPGNIPTHFIQYLYFAFWNYKGSLGMPFQLLQVPEVLFWSNFQVSLKHCLLKYDLWITCSRLPRCLLKCKISGLTPCFVNQNCEGWDFQTSFPTDSLNSSKVLRTTVFTSKQDLFCFLHSNHWHSICPFFCSQGDFSMALQNGSPLGHCNKALGDYIPSKMKGLQNPKIPII